MTIRSLTCCTDCMIFLQNFPVSVGLCSVERRGGIFKVGGVVQRLLSPKHSNIYSVLRDLDFGQIRAPGLCYLERKVILKILLNNYFI